MVLLAPFVEIVWVFEVGFHGFSGVLGAEGLNHGWEYAKRFFVLLNLNCKFSILDSFPNDGSIFSTAPKKINQKAQGKKELSHYFPIPEYLTLLLQMKYGVVTAASQETPHVLAARSRKSSKTCAFSMRFVVK